MALNRANITVVDDDGTETVGTVFDSEFFEALYDEIDAAIAADIAATKLDDLATPDDNTDLDVSTSRHGLVPKITGSDGDVLTKSGTGAVWAPPAGGGGTFTEQTTTATGAQHNFDLDAHLTYLRCTGAAPAFSGFTVMGGAPAAGDRVYIECLGTTAKVTHQDTNSTAAHRAICPSTNGQIVGTNGLMLLIYDDTTDRWREHLIEPGAPIDVAHAGGNFTAGGSQTWTVASGDQKTFAYQQRGTVLQVWVRLVLTTVGGTPHPILKIAVPGGFTGKAADQPSYVAAVVNNGTPETGSAEVANGSTTIDVYRAAGANWSAATDNTNVYVATEFAVQ